MIKKYHTLLTVVILSFVYACASTNPGKLTIEKAFKDMLESSDKATRITAIIMLGEFKTTSLNNTLATHLKTADGVEKTAILYSLSLNNHNYLEAFVESVPTDSNGIKTLLEIESPKGSYFKAPYLRIINYLGILAKHDDNALLKLREIDNYADGWQGDSIMELIAAAQNARKQ